MTTPVYTQIEVIQRGDEPREALFERALGVVPESANAKKRTIDIVLSDERTNTVRTYSRAVGEVVDQRLSLDPAHVRLGRLNSGAPFLIMHAREALLGSSGAEVARMQVGKIVEGSARIEGEIGERQLIATVLFSRNLDEDNERHVADIFDGIRRNVSVGFKEHAVEVRQREDGPSETLAVDWEPFEGSSVTMGADPGAHFRAESPTQPTETEARAMTTKHDPKAGEARAEVTETENHVDVAAVKAEAERAFAAKLDQRAADLRQLGVALGADAERVNGWISERAGGLPVEFGQIRDREINAAAKRDDDVGIQGHASIQGGEDTAEIHRGLSKVGYLLCNRGGFRPEQVRAAMKANKANRADFVLRNVSDAMIDGFDFRREGAVYEHRGELFQLACLALEEQGHDLRSMGRAEIIESAIGMHGLHGRGQNTVSAFPLLLAEVLNTSIRIGYDEHPRTFEKWTKRASARDFRTKYNLTMGEADDLVQLAEKQEIPTSTMDESREGYKIESYGRIFGLTFKLMVQDYLDGLTQIPRKFGAAGVRKQREIVYGLLTANANLSDGQALFGNGSAATRSINDDGTPSVFSIAAADRMRVRFATRQGLRASTIVPHTMRHLICGHGKETFINQVLGRVVVESRPRDLDEQVTSSFTGWSVTADSEIDAHDAGGGTGNAWYGTDGESIETAFLSGMEGIQTATKDDFERLGMKIRATMHFGAGVVDWRGLDRNQGA